MHYLHYCSKIQLQSYGINEHSVGNGLCKSNYHNAYLAKVSFSFEMEDQKILLMTDLYVQMESWIFDSYITLDFSLSNYRVKQFLTENLFPNVIWK